MFHGHDAELDVINVGSILRKGNCFFSQNVRTYHLATILQKFSRLASRAGICWPITVALFYWPMLEYYRISPSRQARKMCLFSKLNLCQTIVFCPIEDFLHGHCQCPSNFILQTSGLRSLQPLVHRVPDQGWKHATSELNGEEEIT